MTGCETYRDLHELLRDGALEGTEAAEARAHGAWCAACRVWVEETDAVVAPLADLPPGPFLPPEGDGPSSPWPLSGPGLLLGALLLLGGAGAILALAGPPESPGSGSRDGTEAGRASPAPPAGAAAVPPGASPAPPPPPDSPAGTATLTGRVATAVDGTALPHIPVAVDGTPAALTDAAGVFTLRGLAPGGARALRWTEPDGSERIALLPGLDAGTTTVLGDLPSGPPSPLAVRVIGLDAAPLPGAPVRALPLAPVVHPHPDPTFRRGEEDPWAAAAIATAGPDGLARFAALPPGEYALVAGDPDGARSRPVRVRLPRRSGEGPVPPLLVDGGASLRGRVVEGESGAPVPGAVVAVLPRSDLGSWDDCLHHRLAVAGPNGEFRVEAVPGIPLLLAVRRDGTAPWAAAIAADPAARPRVEIRLPAEGTLRGSAEDPGSGEPLPGVLLVAEIRAPVAGLLATRAFPRTGEDGSFALPRVPRGSRIRIRAAGGTGRAPAAAEEAREFPFRPDEPVRLPLLPAGSVEGRVSTHDGEAAGGARVTLFLPGGPAGPVRRSVALAGADGRFRIEGVPAGAGVLVASPPGEDPLSGRPREEALRIARTAGEDPGAVAIAPGAAVRVDLLLASPAGEPDPGPPPPAPPGPIRGVVRTADGRRPEGLRVYRRSPGKGDSGSRPGFVRLLGEPVAVAADGSFEDPGPTRGPDVGPAVAFAAFAPGFAPAVAVARPGEGAVVRLVLRPEEAIEGRILRADGSPADGIPVGAAPEALAATPLLLVPVAVSGPDGSFRVGGLAAGRHAVVAGESGHPLHRVAVDLPAAGPLTVRLPARRDLGGRVTGPEGEPAAGIPVLWLPREGPGDLRRTVTDPEGRFLLRGVEAVPFRIALGDPAADADPGEFVGRVTETLPGDHPEVRVTLDRGRAISGTVVGAAGRPAAGIPLAATWEGGRGRTTVSAADGSFRLRGLPPGPVVLHAGGPRTGAARLRVEEGAGSVRVGLSAEAGGPADGSLLPLAGRVVDEAGRPLPFVRVAASPFPGGTGPPALTTTDAEGEFRVEVAGGRTRWTLRAGEEDGPAAYGDGIAAGEEDLVLRVGVVPPRGIRGEVRGPEGDPVPGIPVFAFPIGEGGGSPSFRLGPEGGAAAFAALGAAGARSTRTGPDGSFHLGSPAGRWLVVAGLPGEDLVPAGGVVAEGEDPGILRPPVARGWTLRARAFDDGSPPEVAARYEVPVSPLAGERGPRFVLPATAASGGTLTVPGLPPGPAVLVRRDAAGGETGRWTIEPMSPDDPPAELR